MADRNMPKHWLIFSVPFLVCLPFITVSLNKHANFYKSEFFCWMYVMKTEICVPCWFVINPKLSCIHCYKNIWQTQENLSYDAVGKSLISRRCKIYLKSFDNLDIIHLLCNRYTSMSLWPTNFTYPHTGYHYSVFQLFLNSHLHGVLIIQKIYTWS
jgi:hypothetical protein